MLNQKRRATELSDARMDVISYACLVAIMSTGTGYHRVAEHRLHERTAENGAAAPIVSSAGALIEGLQALGARKVAMIAPYMKPLTKLVVDYIESAGIEVLDAISLEIPDNLEVGRRDPLALPDICAEAEYCECRRDRAVGLRTDAFTSSYSDRAVEGRLARRFRRGLYGLSNSV